MTCDKAIEARRAYMRQYREKNKERLAAYNREYLKKWRKYNSDKIKDYNEKYFAKLYDKMQKEG